MEVGRFEADGAGAAARLQERHQLPHTAQGQEADPDQMIRDHAGTARTVALEEMVVHGFNFFSFIILVAPLERRPGLLLAMFM